MGADHQGCRCSPHPLTEPSAKGRPLDLYSFGDSVADIQSWRVPYLEEKIHEQFRTHIYGWVSPGPAPSCGPKRAKADTKTWEDPDVDVKKLGINKSDHVLAITSAGDNVLHYALAAQCERIHAVGA